MPVYVEYKGGRTKTVTILKKYTGDVKALANDFSAVCNSADVTIRPGKMYVKGKHTHNVKQWLEMMGF